MFPYTGSTVIFRKEYTFFASSVFILLLLIAPLSPRSDHNHMLMDPIYAPIPLEKPIDMAFFQLGTERYVRRTFPEPEWVYQDWYISTPQAYGGATTMLAT